MGQLLVMLSSTLGLGQVTYVDYSVIVAAVNVDRTGPFSNPVVGRSGENGKTYLN